MAGGLMLEIVTPERRVLSERVDEVVLPSVEGSMGVLPGHAPLLARLEPGEVSYRVGDVRKFLAVSGGHAEVLRDAVNVLARTAERAEEIDLERAQRAKTEAQSVIESVKEENDFHRAEIRLKRALARLDVGGRARR
jgi:F-type H+-transporting ATPase subunit epsilon